MSSDVRYEWRLVPVIPDYENEDLPLARRAELAFLAGKRSRARELNDLNRGVESLLNSDWHQLNELTRLAAEQHTHNLPESGPVNPGMDFVQKFGGGGR